MSERRISPGRLLGNGKALHRKSRSPRAQVLLSVLAVVIAGACIGAVVRLLVGTGSAKASSGPGAPVTTGSPATSTPATSTHGTSTTTPATTTTVASTTTTVPATTTTSAPSTTTTVPATTTTAAPTLAPSRVLVEVLNGSGATAAATSTAKALREEGFLVNGTGNAGSFGHVENVAEYSAGSEEAATTIAAWVSGGTELVEVKGLAPNEVYLVLGSSFHGLTG
ncbi:MAG: Transcriptional attenuator, LytR family [Acidimicrobiaceae bacterium]|nr:Transcriptional attenuator, LytR family [Acidimicrobiaceae bacterium]